MLCTSGNFSITRANDLSMLPVPPTALRAFLLNTTAHGLGWLRNALIANYLGLQ